jgi:hypothetical protein
MKAEARDRERFTASEMYEAEAALWEQTGELQENEYMLLTLRCWFISNGAAATGVSMRLRDYCAAALRAGESRAPGWYEALLRVREACSVCGETYRIENLSLCTHCEAMLGYCHQLSGGTASNGNPLCPRCGIGEIVG